MPNVSLEKDGAELKKENMRQAETGGPKQEIMLHVSVMNIHTHSHMYTHSHSCTHTHMHTPTLTHVHALTHVFQNPFEKENFTTLNFFSL